MFRITCFPFSLKILPRYNEIDAELIFLYDALYIRRMNRMNQTAWIICCSMHFSHQTTVKIYFCYNPFLSMQGCVTRIAHVYCRDAGGNKICPQVT